MAALPGGTGRGGHSRQVLLQTPSQNIGKRQVGIRDDVQTCQRRRNVGPGSRHFQPCDFQPRGAQVFTHAVQGKGQHFRGSRQALAVGGSGGRAGQVEVKKHLISDERYLVVRTVVEEPKPILPVYIRAGGIVRIDGHHSAHRSRIELAQLPAGPHPGQGIEIDTHVFQPRNCFYQGVSRCRGGEPLSGVGRQLRQPRIALGSRT